MKGKGVFVEEPAIAVPANTGPENTIGHPPFMVIIVPSPQPIMNAFDVAFHQINLRGEAAFARIVFP